MPRTGNVFEVSRLKIGRDPVNPFYHMIELVRAPLLGHQATLLNWQVALGTLAVVIVMAFISVSIARKRISLWI